MPLRAYFKVLWSGQVLSSQFFTGHCRLRRPADDDPTAAHHHYRDQLQDQVRDRRQQRYVACPSQLMQLQSQSLLELRDRKQLQYGLASSLSEIWQGYLNSQPYGLLWNSAGFLWIQMYMFITYFA